MGTAQANVNFLNAARRHFEDAEFLHGNGRIQNAGHLFGFHAECGLKALLRAHGVGAGSVGIEDKYKKHVDKLVALIQALTVFPDGRTASIYISMLPKLSLFSTWLVEHRYWDAAAITKAMVDEWREASIEIGKVLDDAKTRGVVL
jgi:hypothetical protein